MGQSGGSVAYQDRRYQYYIIRYGYEKEGEKKSFDGKQNMVQKDKKVQELKKKK